MNGERKRDGRNGQEEKGLTEGKGKLTVATREKETREGRGETEGGLSLKDQKMGEEGQMKFV